jgi:hypothetical protein
MLSVIWPTATNAMSEVTTVDASLLEMILKAQDGVRKLMERRAKLTGLDAPEKVQEVGAVSDAKASLLAKLRKMAERMRPAEIAPPLKDVTPAVIEHEPSADANETSMIRFADVTKSAEQPAAPTLVTEVDRVTKNIAKTGRVTKPVAGGLVTPATTPPVTKKGGRPANGERPMTPAEKQRAYRERHKAKD